MYSEIFESVRTKHELDLLVAEIATLKESLYETKAATFDEILKKKVRDHIADMIKLDIKKDEKITNREYLDGLEKALKKIKVIVLTISFEPTEETVQNVFEWVNKNLGAGIIIHFLTRPAIVGGVIIESNGKYHDYSIARNLDELFQAKSESIVVSLVKTS